ncbi:NAD(P)H-dependent oxidoreductase [Gracilimonas tropica]|uniref:NAD(P)H-dependent oxidoreductase n=1 Tax=Gracilimonas tropica TaxID=454600 RepID=UPI000377EC20|nr:NAD(P)H-dependent oxidoreductase [Gracilimonas tropica]
MQLLENLNWRYATKKFDSNKKLSPNDLSKLKEAIRLSVSSYGLQLYKVLVIEDPEIRKELRKASWDQPQITDASHLFVFCRLDKVTEHDIDNYVSMVISQNHADEKALHNYGSFIKEKVFELPEHETHTWMEKQVYLALNNLLVACAELKIDACPMEGFEKESYDDILNLRELGLKSTVIAPVGYRSSEDESQYWGKVRKSTKELFHTMN